MRWDASVPFLLDELSLLRHRRQKYSFAVCQDLRKFGQAFLIRPVDKLFDRLLFRLDFPIKFLLPARLLLAEAPTKLDVLPGPVPPNEKFPKPKLLLFVLLIDEDKPMLVEF